MEAKPLHYVLPFSHGANTPLCCRCLLTTFNTTKCSFSSSNRVINQQIGNVFAAECISTLWKFRLGASVLWWLDVLRCGDSLRWARWSVGCYWLLLRATSSTGYSLVDQSHPRYIPVWRLITSCRLPRSLLGQERHRKYRRWIFSHALLLPKIIITQKYYYEIKFAKYNTLSFWTTMKQSLMDYCPTVHDHRVWVATEKHDGGWQVNGSQPCQTVNPAAMYDTSYLEHTCNSYIHSTRVKLQLYLLTQSPKAVTNCVLIAAVRATVKFARVSQMIVDLAHAQFDSKQCECRCFRRQLWSLGCTTKYLQSYCWWRRIRTSFMAVAS